MTDTPPAIDPTRSALLVMDYQPGIVGMLEDAEPLLERITTAIDAARQAGLHVGYVRVAFDDPDYAAIPETNKSFSALAPGYLHHESPDTQVHERVAPQPGDIVVRKTRVGAFSTTDLHQQLQDRGVDTIILGGISTSGVVLSTVRDGADRDYRVYVLADGSADPDTEVHEVLTQKVFPRQAHVVTVDELTDLLSR